MRLSGHRNLIAWQRAMDLAVGAYNLGRALRRRHHSALASQLERAAVSVPANVAEGCGRNSPGDLTRFLRIALGSLREVQTLLELAYRLRAATVRETSPLLERADEVGKLVFGLLRAASGVSRDR
jgi:four helix bundle protein